MCSSDLFELYKQALNDIEDQLKVYDEIREYNQLKVLHAFQEERISDSHFTNSSGYGYDDIGREALDKVYARVFNAESALVRPHFVNVGKRPTNTPGIERRNNNAAAR